MSLFSELQRRNVFRVALAYSVVAWLVAQVAELAFDSFGTPDWAMKTLLFVLVMGLPIAVIFAWAFEMTPEGLKREKDVDRSNSITDQTGRKLNHTIIAVLAAALVLSLVTRDWSSETPGDAPTIATEGDDKSIAVLPFVNMSDDKENEYFSDGISEELLNVLVKVEGLRVASRTSSFSFKGKDKSIPDIAEALNVEHVLEGSVRKAGDTIRITAQLIDVKTDSHLWSETYDRKFEDIFVIQDEISAHIVEALKVALGAGEVVETETKPTENLAAYEDYLRGRYFWQRRGGENIGKAIGLFQRATAADPDFARAWSSLAAAHLTMPTYSGEPDGDHFPQAMEYARKALGLDPSIAEAHAVIGDLLRLNKNWIEAEPHYLRAIELEPRNPTGYLWYSEQMACVGNAEGALANALKAIELDPFNPGAISMLSFAYLMNGDMDKARKYMESARDLGHPGAIFQLIQLEMYLGNFDKARRLIAETVPEIGEDGALAFEAYLDTVAQPDNFDAFLELTANEPEISEFHFGLDHVQFGRVDTAIELVLNASINGSEWMDIWVPDVRALRQHPRFGELLEKDGLVQYWDKYGWPVQCSRDGEQITCN